MSADPDFDFLRAIRSGEIDRVREFVNNGTTDLRRGLTFATLYGQVDITRFFINKLLELPKYYGHLDSSMHSVSSARLGEHCGSFNINQLLVSVAIGGNPGIVNLVLEYNPTNIEEAAGYAAAAGHIEVIKILIDRGAKNFDDMLHNASLNERNETFKEIYNMITEPKEIISSDSNGQIVKISDRPDAEGYVFLPID